jgi:hypothetical protein
MNGNIQRRLLDLFDSIGTAVVGIIALMDDRIRPILEEIVTWVRSFGLRSARLARQLFERHLIAVILRPVLIATVAIVYPAMMYGFSLASRVTGGHFDPEASNWFFWSMVVLCAFALLVLAFNFRQRGMTDADIRRLRERSPVLTGLRATYNQALDLHNQIVQTMQVAHQQALLAHQQAVQTAVQNNTRPPRAPRPPTLPAAPELPELQLTPQQRTQVADWLQNEVRREFGPTGHPVRLALAILAIWGLAGVWFVALGGVLGTFHRAALWNAHFDHRWSSAFVAVGAVFVVIAFLLWIAGAVLSAATVRFGFGAILWTVRVVAKPAINALPFWDDQNLDEIIAPDLGVPLAQWQQELLTAHEYPLAVTFMALSLMATMPNVYYFGFIGVLALVLLGGWYTLRVFHIREELAIKRIIIGLFILAVYQMIRLVQGTDVMSDYRFVSNLWYGFIGADWAALIVVGAVGLALGGAIKWLAPHDRVGKIAIYAGGGIALASIVVCGILWLAGNQRADSRYRPDTGTGITVHESHSDDDETHTGFVVTDPRPPRSPS